MSLSNKYNVPHSTIIKMVNDGVIPGSVIRYQEVYDKCLHYKSKNAGQSNNQMFHVISEELKMNYDNVKKIFYIMEKRM